MAYGNNKQHRGVHQEIDQSKNYKEGSTIQDVDLYNPHDLCKSFTLVKFLRLVTVLALTTF